ncbi:MAG TPA: hypothetical protein VMB71_07500, partial [Acetobacteraceae bacterium]|nr:hypothetical protein [Acetobacteraceae bacterium]
YEFPLAGIGNASGQPPNPIGLNKRGEVFFTYFIDISAPTDGAYGIPPNFRNVPALNRYNTIESMNWSGMVAGTSYTLSGADQVFAGRGKNFTSLTPPGATSVKGGFINDKGDVAGTWRDSSNVWHGFLYSGGTYASFDMPEAASSMAVTGINGADRVVGTYVSTADSHQHGFLYNGTTVSSFGKFNQFDNVVVALNAAGKIIVSNQLLGNEPAYHSYRVTCSGSGC